MRRKRTTLNTECMGERLPAHHTYWDSSAAQVQLVYIHKVRTALREHYIYTIIKSTGICTKHKELHKNNHRIHKSAVKRWSTLGGLDQYTTPNTKLNTLEMSAPPPPAFALCHMYEQICEIRCLLMVMTPSHAASEFAQLFGAWNGPDLINTAICKYL